jgi:hypothetical protein
MPLSTCSASASHGHRCAPIDPFSTAHIGSSPNSVLSNRPTGHNPKSAYFRIGHDRPKLLHDDCRSKAGLKRLDRSDYYSARNELIGSTCVARRAGKYMPAREMTTSKAAAMVNTDASKLRKGKGEFLVR